MDDERNPRSIGGGRVTRRELIARAGVALAGGVLASLVAACSSGGSAQPTSAAAKPTTPSAPAATTAPAAAGASPAPAATAAAKPGAAQGAGGTLKILMWQGPTILNPHLSQGTKDYIASRMCCEPLMTVSGDGKFSPVLAAEVPSKENGGLGADGKTVTYKLKKDIKWADGKPFTADDVVFTHQFVTNKETSAVTLGTYLDLEKVEAIDPLTVKLTFKEPTGGWYGPFTGTNGMVVPKHALQEFTGANARNAPFNLKSFGTGPFMVEDFKPGDLVVMKANPNYREPGKPFFARVEIKGGGDAVSAARSVLETGEYDYAWNMQVEAQVLEQIKKGGKGVVVTAPGSGVEQIYFNMADPNTEVDGERSSPKSKHPFLTDQKVREAMALAIDRPTMAKQLYGETGDATANVLTTPTSLASKNTRFEFALDKANKMLDDAGYKKGGDGIRVTPEGVRMKVVFQTSINSLRQKEQALVKDGWQKLGIETELKSVDAGVFFSSSPSNPDTFAHFSTDTAMFTSTFESPFPLSYMKRFYSADSARDWAQKSNEWAGNNFMKWTSPEYNALYEQVKVETDVAKAGQLWIKMNDLVVNSFISVPLVERKFTEAKSNALKGPDPGPFDCVFAWNMADWTKG
jgi:peptide/nickel transport system substrate-binding protein